MWLLFLALSAFASNTRDYLCNNDNSCGSRGFITEHAAGPSKSDSIKVNPAAVPVEEVTGIETIVYNGSFDFGLVKGLGRVGAAISPSNNDETFFGPPAAEYYQTFLDRMDSRSKLNSGKYTLAAAVSLLSKNGSGFRNLHLQLGAMARYESFSHHVKPGLGLQGIAGPLYAGVSYLQDEDRLDDVTWLNTALQTYSFGISLDSLLLDYSVMKVSGDFEAQASVITAAVFIDRFILTLARRTTTSDTKAFYDFSTSTLAPVTSQSDYFGGVQAKATTFLILGAFYNYYLLHEASLGATFFF